MFGDNRCEFKRRVSESHVNELMDIPMTRAHGTFPVYLPIHEWLDFSGKCRQIYQSHGSNGYDLFLFGMDDGKWLVLWYTLRAVLIVCEPTSYRESNTSAILWFKRNDSYLPI